MKPVRIILHHSADAYAGSQLNKIDRYHKLRGFPVSSLGYFVGYTYLIDQKGVITQTRRDNETQAHTFGWNDGSIGICLEGNLDKNFPPQKQCDALAHLLIQKMKEYNIKLDEVYFHRHLRPTDCPGTNITEDEITELLTPKETDVPEKSVEEKIIDEIPDAKPSWIVRMWRKMVELIKSIF